MKLYLKCIPNLYYESIYQIDYQKLKEQNIKALIFDLDNTLIDYNKKQLTKEIINFLNNLSKDFKIIIVSNSKNKRVSKAINNNFPFISFAKKPLKVSFKKALKILKVKKEEMANVGDQLVTDILGGNRFKITTILVDPIAKDTERKSTKFNRRIEKYMIDKIMKKVSNDKKEVLLKYVQKYY